MDKVERRNVKKSKSRVHSTLHDSTFEARRLIPSGNRRDPCGGRHRPGICSNPSAKGVRRPSIPTFHSIRPSKGSGVRPGHRRGSMSDPMGSFRLEQIGPAGRDPRESDAAYLSVSGSVTIRRPSRNGCRNPPLKHASSRRKRMAEQGLWRELLGQFLPFGLPKRPALDDGLGLGDFRIIQAESSRKIDTGARCWYILVFTNPCSPAIPVPACSRPAFLPTREVVPND